MMGMVTLLSCFVKGLCYDYEQYYGDNSKGLWRVSLFEQYTTKTKPRILDVGSYSQCLKVYGCAESR